MSIDSRNNRGQPLDDAAGASASRETWEENEDNEFFFFLAAAGSDAPMRDRRNSDPDAEVAIDESGAFFLIRED